MLKIVIMDLSELTKRAMHLKDLFAKYESERFGKKWSRQHIAQGLVGDIGDLMKIIMAKEGFRKAGDVDRKLAHELSDCLWSILVLAQLYGINLEESFLETVSEIEKTLQERFHEKK